MTEEYKVTDSRKVQMNFVSKDYFHRSVVLVSVLDRFELSPGQIRINLVHSIKFWLLTTWSAVKLGFLVFLKFEGVSPLIRIPPAVIG